jgi:hypothetical protein
MQFLGYAIIKGEKIPLLCRAAKTYNSYKIRKSGTDGTIYSKSKFYRISSDDEEYLEKNPHLIELLKSGETIKL